MSTVDESGPVTVALIGNPNTGKSTLFSALVGVHQRVGNYPGVTVEKKTGQMECHGRRYEVVDLPGLYSLAARSRDEMVAVDLLLGRSGAARAVDAVICIVDASNLERNLYLVCQVLDLGLPTIVALNMLDVACDRSVSIDVARLRSQLGIPVVPIQANRRIGIETLRAALAGVIGRPAPPCDSPFPQAFREEVQRLAASWTGSATTGRRQPLPRYLVERLLLDASGSLREAVLSEGEGPWVQHLEAARSRLAAAGCQLPGVETQVRYEWVQRKLDGVVAQPHQYPETFTDRLDRVLTHRVWGMIVFALVMVVTFQAVFVGATPITDWINGGVELLASAIESHMAEGALRSLLVDGVVHGAGGVLVFLPQIMILFVFIGILEDCGYMARAAFLMDRWMVRVGLSGKSFIPLLSSFACAIPGIMSARVIEDERDRLATILAAPLMTCSARLPVYALLIAAFIPRQPLLGGLLSLQGVTLMALYLLGIVTAIVVVLLLKRTILRGQAPPLLLELPSYKWPSLRTIFFRVAERAWLFVECAGTLILAVSVVVWAALYYPHRAEVVEKPFLAERAKLAAQLAHQTPGSPEHAAAAEQWRRLQHEIAGAYQRQSWLGRLGRLIEPVFQPLGWDWRIGSAVIASFPARETVVATMGVIYNLPADVSREDAGEISELQSKLYRATWDGSDRPVFNAPVALSIMVFYALCAQCVATLAVIRRETNSWRWPAFAFAYMTALAYVGALLTYQVGMWIAG